MAERRMVSKVISISEKVNSLSLFGRLLYTWMIPHADDFGRLPGSPAKVRALVVPMADETVKDVEQALADMHERGLIIWYEVDGERFIQITNFEKHQQGLHKRTKSKFPEPPDEFREIPGNSEEFPLELEGNKNRTEYTPTTPNNARDEEKDAQVFRVFEQEGFGTLSSVLVDDLRDMIDTYSAEWVIRAMHEAVRSGKRNLRYVLAILKRWKAEGIDKPWEVRGNAEHGRSNQRGVGEFDFLSL
jgi:DnaD/phage-associated family protein